MEYNEKEIPLNVSNYPKFGKWKAFLGEVLSFIGGTNKFF